MNKAAILRYLAARYAFEPLPHYAMIAVEICGDNDALPPFAREFLGYLAGAFMDERDERTRVKPCGVFPDFTTQQDKASDQWRRAEDCALFLTDEDAAFRRQQHRLWLVEEVEKRHAARLTYEQIFNDLSLEGDEEQSEFALKRQWQSIVGQRSGFEDEIPIALLPDGEIVYRAVKART